MVCAGGEYLFWSVPAVHLHYRRVRENCVMEGNWIVLHWKTVTMHYQYLLIDF